MSFSEDHHLYRLHLAEQPIEMACDIFEAPIFVQRRTGIDYTEILIYPQAESRRGTQKVSHWEVCVHAENMRYTSSQFRLDRISKGINYTIPRDETNISIVVSELVDHVVARSTNLPPTVRWRCTDWIWELRLPGFDAPSRSITERTLYVPKVLKFGSILRMYGFRRPSKRNDPASWETVPDSRITNSDYSMIGIPPKLLLSVASADDRNMLHWPDDDWRLTAEMEQILQQPEYRIQLHFDGAVTLRTMPDMVLTAVANVAQPHALRPYAERLTDPTLDVLVDLQLLVGAERQPVRMHKALLAVHSSVMRAMMSDRWVTRRAGTTTTVMDVELPLDGPVVWQRVARFMFTGRLDADDDVDETLDDAMLQLLMEYSDR